MESQYPHQVPTRQAILGSSESNKLIITPPLALGTRVTVLAPQPTNGAGILRLPDELLLQIVELVAYPITLQRGRHFENYADSVALAKTCLRFYRLVAPSMYSRFSVSINSITPSPYMSARAARRLRQTLGQNKWLRHHCRALHIGVGDTTHCKIHIPIIADLTRWLTQTRRFSVHGGFQAAGEQTWSVVHAAVTHMPLLQEVSLCREAWGLRLPQVCETLGSSAHLRTVHLGGISPVGKVPWGALKEGSSSVTSLSISDFEDSPENLGKLLTWPARLEHFSFSRMYSNTFGSWSLPAMVSVLSRHKASLQALVLGRFRQRGLAGFDLTGFDSLEELSLSYWATGSAVNTSWGLLEAPRLREFCWSFTSEDQHSESLFDFGQPEERWLRALITAAMARNLPMRDVRIQYQPYYRPSPGVARPGVYPWDRMDRLKSEIRAAGICLSYDTPTVPRDVFEGHIYVDEALLDEVTHTEAELETGSESSENNEPDEATWGHGPAQSNTILNYFSIVSS